MGRRTNTRALGRATTAATVVALVAAGIVGTATSAGAAVTNLYVDRANAACSDTGSGSVTVPFCTVVRAAKVATAGQTVHVAAGTYGGNIALGNSGTSTAPIVLTAAPGTTVAGGTNGIKVSGRSWITISGFAVTGTTGAGIYLTGSTSITVAGNTVTNAGQPVDGLVARGIKVSDTSASTITGNTTAHNSDAGIGVSGTASDNDVISRNTSFANARGYVRAAAGFDIRDGSGNVVSGNVSHDNEDSGFNIWIGSSATRVIDNVSYRNGDHGIDVHDAVNADVVANTVNGNVDSGIEMTTSTGSYLANNVTTDNGINSPRTSGNIRADAASVGTATVDFDLVSLRVPGVMVDWAGVRYPSLVAFRTATGLEPHGIEADPRFRSAAGGDFHLLAGSKAIDSANSAATGQPATDFDGAARFNDPATVDMGAGPVLFVDRGAFEFRG